MADKISEANRFWVDMSQNPILATKFLKLGLKLEPHATPVDDANTFFTDNNYLTDTATVIDVYTGLLQTSTLPYYGVYSLFAPGADTRHVLEIGSAGVWFDGVEIKGSTVSGAVLSWSAGGTPANSSSASLALSIVGDQVLDPSLYFGPICKGSVTPVPGAKLDGLIGKRRVFSHDGVMTSDTATDSLTWWAGRYAVMFNATGSSIAATAGPDLVIDASGVVTFGAKVQTRFTNNTLTWESGGNSLNASKGNIVFDLSYDGVKRFRGSLVPDALASSSLDTPMNSAGTLSEVMPPANAKLAIVTATLPNGVVRATYAATLVPAGGKPPYHWEQVGALPGGLTFTFDPTTGAGSISGTPTAPAVASLTFTLSDAGSPIATATQTLPLTVTDSAPTNVATTTLSVMSILASFGSAFLFFRLKRKQDKKDAKAKKEAEDAAKRLDADNGNDPDVHEMMDMTQASNPATRFNDALQSSTSVATSAALRATANRRTASLARANATLAQQASKAAEARRDAAQDQATKDAEQAEMDKQDKLERAESRRADRAERAGDAADHDAREAANDAEAATQAEAAV